MGKNPCFLFYPNDWERDISSYPWEVGGAWMLTLCTLYWDGGESTKSLDEWARILRENRKKTLKIFQFFAEKNIGNVLFLDNQKITITCRRMKRDLEIRELRRSVGKLGGNPNLKKKQKNLVNQNPTLPVPVPVSYPKKNKTLYSECVLLTKEEYQKLVIQHGQNLTDKAIKILNDYIMSSGKKYKSHYHTIIRWPIERAKENGNAQTSVQRFGVRREPELSGEAERAIAEVKRLERERAAQTSTIDNS
jgi:hypothetical protein